MGIQFESRSWDSLFEQLRILAPLELELIHQNKSEIRIWVQIRLDWIIKRVNWFPGYSETNSISPLLLWPKRKPKIRGPKTLKERFLRHSDWRFDLIDCWRQIERQANKFGRLKFWSKIQLQSPEERRRSLAVRSVENDEKGRFDTVEPDRECSDDPGRARRDRSFPFQLEQSSQLISISRARSLQLIVELINHRDTLRSNQRSHLR